MKVSTEICSAARKIGEEKAIELYAKAGFDAYDLSMFDMVKYDWTNNKVLPTNHPFAGADYLKFVRNLRHIADECGIECNQSHAPFPTRCPEIRSLYKRAIECSAEAGAKICIIHPDNNATPEENAKMYLEVLDYAKSCGVKIATENMWNWDADKNEASFAACATPESFLEHFKALDDDYFVACLDIGYAEMRGQNTSAIDMINKLGTKLQALHIHDNDKWHDSHQIPFSMDIDFDAIVRALKQNNYQGHFTLEADQYLSKYTNDNIFEGMQNLYGAVNKLSNMYEAL